MLTESRLTQVPIITPLSMTPNESSFITDQLLSRHLFKRIALLLYLHHIRA